MSKFSSFGHRFRYGKIHISWLVAWVCGGAIGGVVLSLLPARNYFAWPIWLVVAGLLLFVVFAKKRFYMIILALIAGLLIGLWRGTITRVDMNSYAPFYGQTVTIFGVVAEDPDIGNSGEYKMKVSQAEINGVHLSGQIWISASTKLEIKRSDRVEISGKLKTGFANFPAMMTFAKVKNVTRTDMADPARDVRDWFGEQLAKSVSEPESDLGMGILAGQKRALPSDISDAFRIAGLTHIVVASGYNLTILVRFSRRLFAKVSRFAAASGAGIFVFAFACVTGFSPSMTRAAIVAGLSLLTWYYGRKTHPVVLLTFVAALTVLYNPLYAWGDVGWLMSFGSFVGVIMLSPLIQDYFWEKKKSARFAKKPKNLPEKIKRKLRKPESEKTHPIRQIFVDTMSAQIMVAPIIALFMGQFAPYGMLANLLVLPLVPFTMLLTFFAGIAGWILPENLAQIVGWPAQKLLEYIINVGQWVSEIPGALQKVQFGWLPCVILYALIFAAGWWMWRVTKHKFRDDQLVE